MATLEVRVIGDPRFSSTFYLIHRRQNLTQYGANDPIEEPCIKCCGIVINSGGEFLARETYQAIHVDRIEIWYRGEFIIAKTGYINDVVIWDNKRFLAESVELNALNFGTGYCKGTFIQEDIHGG